MVITIEDVQKTVRKLGAKIQAPKDLLTVPSKPIDDGSSYLEIIQDEFHYISQERGLVVNRRITTKLDELLYWIIREVALVMAIEFEKEHRDPKIDHRRLIFEHTVYLLKKFDAKWASQEQEIVAETVKSTPFDDCINRRVELCKKYIVEGFSPEEAYEKACLEYPLPITNLE